MIMSSDSSSGEEELEKFKEAVDENFLPTNLYKNGGSSEKCEKVVKPSLRYQNRETASANPFDIKVTPEFQKHVSEHLSSLLDNLVDDSDIIIHVGKKKKSKSQKEDSKSGVKLLHSSRNYLQLTDSNNVNVNVRKIHKKNGIKDIDFEKRAKEVAVSPEWVLSKEEIRHWAPETKGELEILRLEQIKIPTKKNITPKR